MVCTYLWVNEVWFTKALIHPLNHLEIMIEHTLKCMMRQSECLGYDLFTLKSSGKITCKPVCTQTDIYDKGVSKKNNI